MRRVVLLVAVVLAVLLACSGIVPAQTAAPSTSQSDSPKKTPKNKIRGSYIVVLKDDEDAGQVAWKKEQKHDLEIKHVYENALKGFSAEIPEDQVEAVRNNPEVEYVEQDSVVRALDQTLPWGIDKIEVDLSSTKADDGSDSVSNVNAYIIDTGINLSHPDLKVIGHRNFTGDGKNRDCNGHGTHVAGTVAAKDDAGYVVGAAPEAPLTGVKVLGCNGSGTASRVIKGIDWVTANADVDGPDNELRTSDDKPAVANMSLGGGASRALDDAVRRSARSGIFYAVAAGNDGRNACKYSPARAGRTKNPDGTWNKNNGIMAVAASNSSDKEASWSNHGPCVDLWAPGVNILSTRNGGGTTTMSGTSMASPHGAGGAALYLSTHTMNSPSAVESAMKSAATKTANKSKDGRTITRENISTF
jgi:subtilisin family serine protease